MLAVKAKYENGTVRWERKPPVEGLCDLIVLFGSYAGGRMTADSDVDFLVVAESDFPRHKRSRELYRWIRPHRFPMDIIVCTPDEVRRGSRTPVSFVSQALREGETVYAR